MTVEVLTCHGDDAKRWDALIANLPPHARDVHFTSAYARVQEVGGANPLLLAADNGADLMLQPIDLRVIGSGPHLDVVNMYGYGGRYCRRHRVGGTPWPELIGEEIDGLLQTVGAVSEFCALHPMLPPPADATPDKFAVLMDLQRGVVDLHNDMRRAHRRSIRKAVAAGAKIERAEINPENMLLMSMLYRQSMARLSASSRWLFPAGYFDAHADELGEGGCSLYFASLPGGGVERSLLVVHHGEIAYAHFLGSTGMHRDSGIDEHLYYSAALDLKARGFKTFHLGGGATSLPSDSLFQFKAGFSDWTVPVYRTFRVLDEARYAELCSAQRVAEVAQHGRVSASIFQPAYRREFI